ncbi:alpha-N-acetylgalactosaminidase-like isoform X2 [Haliotis rufescens]|nr:alpha-N-acetylgalactosaminidase-like isoform X2 [Haliotis rufescens]XP_048243983.1 alpha-N-acetylgalactosaminidase-like isoform X2 [Haliotis rufescens]
MFALVLLFLNAVTLTLGLDNGLALTPPMGWLDWERFRCNIDCVNDPENCIGELLFKQTADRMASDGWLNAGYEYLIVDDCWEAESRDSDGRLYADPTRFPGGMKALADYVHLKGLKFGVHQDFGHETCSHYPGGEFYLQTDAQTFADWGVDFVKMDGCNSDLGDMDYGYPAFGMFLNKTGRPMIYSCEWPFYQSVKHFKIPDYAAVRRTCNTWRTNKDIQDSWDSLLQTIQFQDQDQGNFSQYAGPGGWNDPDMLILGNFGLSPDMERTQMAMWGILAAPLLMSTDLRNIRNSSKALLQNRRLIAINQDKLGVQGKKIMTVGPVDVWTRPLLPTGSVGIVFFHSDVLTHGFHYPRITTVQARALGLTASQGYNLVDPFDGSSKGTVKPSDSIKVRVNPTGVIMYVATPAS